MTELDPDQLLKSLDAQIAIARSRRSISRDSNRNAIRMGGILILTIGTAVALFALQFMTSEISGRRAVPMPPAVQQSQPGAPK